MNIYYVSSCLLAVAMSCNSYCDEICAVPAEYIEATPLIMVTTKPYNEFSATDCAVFSYKLEIKDSKNPKALVAADITKISSSSTKYEAVAIKALEKWLFLEGKNNIKGNIYYYKFVHQN